MTIATSPSAANSIKECGGTVLLALVSLAVALGCVLGLAPKAFAADNIANVSWTTKSGSAENRSCETLAEVNSALTAAKGTEVTVTNNMINMVDIVPYVALGSV